MTDTLARLAATMTAARAQLPAKTHSDAYAQASRALRGKTLPPMTAGFFVVEPERPNR